MTIEPTEQYGDKTSGLQYSGEPTERALRAKEILNKSDIRELVKNYEFGQNKLMGASIRTDDMRTILEALELMAKEKTND